MEQRAVVSSDMNEVQPDQPRLWPDRKWELPGFSGAFVGREVLIRSRRTVSWRETRDSLNFMKGFSLWTWVHSFHSIPYQNYLFRKIFTGTVSDPTRV